MPHAVSIHIGVSQPLEYRAASPLLSCEIDASRMAEIATRAGYDSIRVLQGQAVTRQAVHEAIVDAARTLEFGDTLFLSFSGHGTHRLDEDFDERHGQDEAWCLYDGILLDDELAYYWTLFKPGARIIVVVDCCYSGGFAEGMPRHMSTKLSSVRRPESELEEAVATAIAPCIVTLPHDCGDIHASVLMLAASREDQTAQDGLFTGHLLDVWDNGAYRGSYCDLYRRVREQMMTEHCTQEPQILMLGSPDPTFLLQTAFHRPDVD